MMICDRLVDSSYCITAIGANALVFIIEIFTQNSCICTPHAGVPYE